MHVMKCSTLISVILSGVLSAGVAAEKTWSSEDQLPAALSEGRNGVVVGTTGPIAVHAGLQTLKNGGSAADAALATALAQPWVDVVLSGATSVAQLRSNLTALHGVEPLEGDGLSAVALDPRRYWSERANLPWT